MGIFGAWEVVDEGLEEMRLEWVINAGRKRWRWRCLSFPATSSTRRMYVTAEVDPHSAVVDAMHDLIYRYKNLDQKDP